MVEVGLGRRGALSGPAGGPERASGESRAAWARRQRCRQETVRAQGQTSRKVTDVLRKLGTLWLPGASPSHHRSMQIRPVLSRLRGGLQGKEKPLEVPSFL